MSLLQRGQLQRTALLVFPLCDSRGYVTQLLRGDDSVELAKSHPESLFLAWLLDLPEGLVPLKAARTLLLVSGCLETPPAEDGSTRSRLYKLFLDAAEYDFREREAFSRH